MAVTAKLPTPKANQKMLSTAVPPSDVGVDVAVLAGVPDGGAGSVLPQPDVVGLGSWLEVKGAAPSVEGGRAAATSTSYHRSLAVAGNDLDRADCGLETMKQG